MRYKQKTIPKNWQIKKISDLLDYERPDKYIVKSTAYSDKYKIPVLTANKSFVLGFTDEDFGIYNNIPIIIFDDFTTDSKYVDFPFKVKSSAIKILKAKNKDVNLKFVYEKIKSIKFPVGSHKRYYISEYQNLDVIIPKRDEQNKIAEILSVVDENIEKTDQVIEKTERMKKGLMRDLLTGRVCVPLSFRTESRIVVRDKLRGERNPLNVASSKNSDNPHSRDFSLSVGMTKKTELGEIPGGWEVKDLVNVATLQRGFDLPIQDRTHGKYPLATSNGITDYHNEYKVLAPGVFTGRSGTIGNVFYIEKNYWPHNTTLYVKDFHGNDEKFIYYFLQKFNLKNFYSGTGVPTVNINIVHKEKVVIPKSKKEQKQIAEILSSVDNKVDINKQIKNKLTQLKKGLMQDLLSGRVRVK